MAFDFPNTPNVGDIAQSPSASYRWDGTKWASSSPSVPIYLPLVGGTISPGPLHINAPSNNAALFLERPSGYYNLIIGATITSPTTVSTRWQIQPGDSTAEAAGNVGSNFAINRFDNSGNYLGSPFFINRANGAVSVAQVLYVNGGQLAIAGAGYPQLTLGTTNAPVDQKNTVCFSDPNGYFGIQFNNDANNDSRLFFQVQRNGYAPVNIRLTAPTIYLTGEVSGSGNVFADGAFFPGAAASGNGYALYMSGGSPQIRFSSDNWHLGWDNNTGNLNYYNNAGGLLFQIAGSGWGWFSAGLTTNATFTSNSDALIQGTLTTNGLLQANNNLMVANGTMYVANNYGCYWSRSGSDGAWRCAESGTVNFTVDTGGGINARTWMTAPNINATSYFTRAGDSVQHNIYVDGTLGLNFRGVFGSGVWYAFGWDGTALNYAINGGGQGQLYTVGQNDGRYIQPGQEGSFAQVRCNSALGVMYSAFWGGWVALAWSAYFAGQLTLVLGGGRAWEFCTQSNAIDFQVYGGAGGPTSIGLGFGDRSNTRGSCFADSWSDIRIKRDIRPTEVDALGLIEAIPVRAFSYIEPMADLYAFMGRRKRFAGDADIRLGLVAQELQEYIPEAVHGLPEGVHNPPDSPIPEGALMISPEPIVPYLLRAIQQLTERIKTLEARTLH